MSYKNQKQKTKGPKNCQLFGIKEKEKNNYEIFLRKIWGKKKLLVVKEKVAFPPIKDKSLCRRRLSEEPPKES